MKRREHLLVRGAILSAVLALVLVSFSVAQNGNGGSSQQPPADGCYVHLFDGDDFDALDDDYVLTEPGRYADLNDLPGTRKDWTGEADSLRVGSAATVTGWSRTNFAGNSTVYAAGSEHPDVDDEPESLELTCDPVSR